MTFKRLIFASVFLFASSAAYTQINIPSIINVLTDPAGTCASPGTPLQYNTQLNHLSACQGASPGPYSWTLVSGGSPTIASGTSTMGTGAITSGTCATVVTTSATGTLTTSTIVASVNGDPTGVTGYAPSASGSLYVWAYPSANNVNFKVCNNTGGTITPGAITFNWKVM